MADTPWDMLSALGTVAAVAVALGVSVHAALETRRADKARSELAAAKMLGPISALERKVSYLFAFFCLSEVKPADQYMNAIMATQELEVLATSITIEDLYLLLHLKGHAANRSARALGLIHNFTADASALLTHHSWKIIEHREIHHKRWGVMLSEIRDHLIVSVRSCQLAASAGAPRPTVDEIHER